MLNKLEIYTGSIQGTVFCYSFNLDNGDFERVFNLKDHIGRLRDVHVSNDGYFVTSGQDESIKIYSAEKKHKLANVFGILGVSPKILSSKDYFISAHENGVVCFIGKTDFAVYHKLRVFKNSCIDIDLHSSGKLIVCLSKTGRFSLWNLSTCSMIFHKKIKVSLEKVLFLDDRFILLCSRTQVYLFDLKSMSLVRELLSDNKIILNDFKVIRFKNKIFLAIAMNDGSVIFFNDQILNTDLEKEAFYIKLKAYESRVKKIDVLENFMVTISTEGDISIWDISEILEEVKEYDQNIELESFAALFEHKIESRLIYVALRNSGTDSKSIKQASKKQTTNQEKKTKKQNLKKNKKIKKLTKKN